MDKYPLWCQQSDKASSANLVSGLLHQSLEADEEELINLHVMVV
jgi:hypothetical protein